MRRFHFASARWFRLPMKLTVLAVTVFALLSLYPALAGDVGGDQRKALLALPILLGFVALGVAFNVLIDDGYIEVGAESLHVRFESFLHLDVPLTSIAAVRRIDPRPRWRYRFGLSTDWGERVSCSHGGPMVELELTRPQRLQLWPRVVMMRLLWLGVRDPDAFCFFLEEQRRYALRIAA